VPKTTRPTTGNSQGNRGRTVVRAKRKTDDSIGAAATNVRCGALVIDLCSACDGRPAVSRASQARVTTEAEVSVKLNSSA
jgi:hypothetical protein